MPATALVLALAIGLGWGLATPSIVRRLPEPAPPPGARPGPDPRTADGASPDGASLDGASLDGARPRDEIDDKLPYASLASPGFAVVVGASTALALAIAGLLLPASLFPVWLVLGTLGLLLAAIDAATTWLPLPLTRVAWAATAGAILVGGATGGWPQAVRGVAGFGIAGLLFGLLWAITRGGFGFGDVRFAPLVGAATASVSWQLLAWALVLGSLVGAVIGLIRLAGGRRGAFAYAPSILAGGYLAAVLSWLTT